jgi:hypothetical protein
VEDIGWISKERAIQMARLGKIDAVIAHSLAGNAYLKTRPDQVAENNLEGMG